MSSKSGRGWLWWLQADMHHWTRTLIGQSFFKNQIHLFILCMCVHMHTHSRHCARVDFRRQLDKTSCLFSMGPRIEFRLLDLVASTSTHWAVLMGPQATWGIVSVLGKVFFLFFSRLISAPTPFSPLTALLGQFLSVLIYMVAILLLSALWRA